MKKYRDNIDKIDQKIITLIAKRMKVSLSIAKFKEKHGLEVNQLDREKTMIEERSRFARKFDLSSKFISNLFKAIIQESKDKQKKYLKK